MINRGFALIYALLLGILAATRAPVWLVAILGAFTTFVNAYIADKWMDRSDA